MFEVNLRLDRRWSVEYCPSCVRSRRISHLAVVPFDEGTVLHQLFERGVDAGADEIDLRLDGPLSACIRAPNRVISTFRADHPVNLRS
ncbi:hypothetical protein [Cohnella faecalis]|uniref:Uncharacterized protein n=1 Tax=Cohnella faecalis TaxID=2315694 RepID=A0A398CWL3_9BACL|nr:hypothetical protein [Cohnella faecalis]RIE03601.1 hypothetical protein D3H35_10705 [Cohnella faecalis]